MKILYFAPIPYDGLKQRPQHIAEILSHQHEVFYVDPTVSSMKYFLKGGTTYKGVQYEVTSRLYVLRLDGTFTLHRSLEALDLFNLNPLSERRQLRKLIAECDIVWVGYCGWYDVISNIKDKKIFYDKMDDDSRLTQNLLLRKLILRVEPKLIQKANCVFVSAQKFYEEIVKKNSRTYLVPNAVCEDIAYFGNSKSEEQKRTFGYVGLISHWFDLRAIETILEADSRNYVFLIGPNELPELKHERLSYLGFVPKERLPKLISTFDICLYPFRQTPLLDSIDPVKIYEYIALNKPVLAVKSIETEKFSDILHLYDSYRELSVICRRGLARPFETDFDRLHFIKRNSWRTRVNIILHELER